MHLRIQTRDIELLFSLASSRVMTRQQAAALHFDGKPEAARKRLQILIKAGYVSRLPINGQTVLSLAEPAAQLLRNHSLALPPTMIKGEQIAKQFRFSPAMISHEVEVAEFRACILTASRMRADVEVQEFITWPDAIAFQAIDRDFRTRKVKPDGFFRLREVDNHGSKCSHSFFLELDRSTESQSVLIDRAICYRNFYRSGEFARRCGAFAQQYKSYPFRLLIVCRSPQRRNNLAQNLLRTIPRFRSQVWLTTFDEATLNPFGTIWLTPKEFEHAVHNRTAMGNHFGGTRHPAESEFHKQQLLTRATESNQTV